MIRLFDIQNGAVIPTEHCYMLPFLKRIMDEYPDNYLIIYAYLFYMTCPNPDINVYFNVPELDKEDMILSDLKSTFAPDEEPIVEALEHCYTMYDTASARAFRGIKTMLDKLAKYMEDTAITSGRDGNLPALISAAKNFDSIRSSFKGAYKDLLEEQQSHVRGGAGLAYDQK